MFGGKQLPQIGGERSVLVVVCNLQLHVESGRILDVCFGLRFEFQGVMITKLMKFNSSCNYCEESATDPQNI
jgi:hypothetical protein